MKKSPVPFEIIAFKKNYADFKDFYDDCEESIFRKMIEAYESLKLCDIKKKKLVYVSTINGISFTTDFLIEESNPIYFKQIILPYFEKSEDYETCSRIKKMITD